MALGFELTDGAAEGFGALDFARGADAMAPELLPESGEGALSPVAAGVADALGITMGSPFAISGAGAGA